MRHTPRIMAPGRTDVSDTVRLSMAAGMGDPAGEGFQGLCLEVQDGLRRVLGTAGPVLTLAGTGRGVWSAVLGGLFAPRDLVLAPEGGPCGRLLSDAASAAGLDVTMLGVPVGRPLTAEALERGLDASPQARAVVLPAVEAATGVAHPLRELAAAAARRGVLMVVDAGFAAGVAPLDMEGWVLDVVVAEGHKGLGSGPGLVVAALSGRAWDMVDARRAARLAYDLLGERERCRQGRFLHAPAVGLVCGLHGALAEMPARDPWPAWVRNRALADMFRAGARALGLEFAAQSGYCRAMTALALPAGVRPDLLALAMAEQFGVVVDHDHDRGARDGRVIRVAHFAPLDFGDVLAALAALRSALPLVGGHSACRDALERAMAAYEQALAQALPETSDTAPSATPSAAPSATPDTI